jgi:LAO/AO transport system kinase
VSELDPGAVDRLAGRIAAGDRGALARAITAVESARPAASQLLRRFRTTPARAMTVGFTGPPGVGKSTLISAFVAQMRERGRSVAVLAVDPSSPVSGGAILGDRVRMAEHSADSGVFIRSIASRGHLGGLSRTTSRVVELVEGAGFDVILIETVGAGQSEVEVAQLAVTTVVVGSPGAGDDVQAIKAGILEVADILVVNKADRPEAAQTRRALEAMLKLRVKGSSEVPVLETVATSGQGLEQLADAVERHQHKALGVDREGKIRARLIAQLADSVATQTAHRLGSLEVSRLEALMQAMDARAEDADEAAARILAQGLPAFIAMAPAGMEIEPDS